jgi:UDP-N-acetylglucosamine 2-epimerase (non-hydrolysing)
MKIGVIFGTRPEAIKLIPVYKQLEKNPNFRTVLICTGQHQELLNDALDFFKIKPDYNLQVMKVRQSLSELSSSIMKKLDHLILQQNIDAVMVQGDTTSAMIGSLVAYYHKLKIFHVEAGLRTGNKYSPYPEEINRKIISQVSDIHFTPTNLSESNLKKENVSGDIVITGNTIVDSLIYSKDLILRNKNHYENLFSNVLNENKKLVLVTIHRRENYENHMNDIFQAIRFLADKHQEYLFVFPRHKNPIILERSDKYFQSLENIHLMEALKYDEFLYLLMNSFLVLSDSGGIQEEAPSFNIPVLIVRDFTERPELIHSNGGVLCGTGMDSIIWHFENIVSSKGEYNKMSMAKNPFGDGKSAELIVDYINRYIRKPKES